MDEYSFECEDGVEDDITELTVKAIVKAGKFMKLPLSLDGEGKKSYNGSWKDVH